MDLSCPHDHSLLIRLEEPPAQIYQCPTCHGIWVPSDMITAILGKGGEPPQFNWHTTKAPPPLPCPEDQSLLTRVLLNGVELEICGTCRGVWLDRGELEYLRAKDAGTLPVIVPLPPVQNVLGGAFEDTVRGVGLTPPSAERVMGTTAEAGLNALGYVLSSPEVVQVIANATGSAIELVVSNIDLGGIVEEGAPHVLGALVDLIVGAISNQ